MDTSQFTFTQEIHFSRLFVANFLELISNKCYEIELTTFHNFAGRDFGSVSKKINKSLSTTLNFQIEINFLMRRIYK